MHIKILKRMFDKPEHEPECRAGLTGSCLPGTYCMAHLCDEAYCYCGVDPLARAPKDD